jgi:hypothetical protein
MRRKPKYLDRERRESKASREFVLRLGTTSLSPTLRKDFIWGARDHLSQIVWRCLVAQLTPGRQLANENS